MDEAPVVRLAQLSDLEALVDLCVEVQNLHAAHRPDLFCPADPEALRTFLAHMHAEKDVTIHVAQLGDEVVGYLITRTIERRQTPFHFASTVVEIDQIDVRDGHRHRGVGSLLMQAGVDEARAIGAQRMQLNSWAFNTSAHEFFESRGFTPAQLTFERVSEPESALS